MATEHAMRAVAEVRTELGSGIDGGADVRTVCSRMADRHANARGRRAGDELGRLVELA